MADTDPTPFNPLDKRNLALSVERAFLEQPLHRLPLTERFNGAGIYAIYYHGDFEPYEPISDEEGSVPIYVGRAMPAGSRAGFVEIDAPSGPVLFNRIKNHEDSIAAAENLELTDFSARYLVVDDAYVAVGEAMLIQRFRPLWNQHVSGFGAKTPGVRRYGGDRSEWDELHPGRKWYPHMRQVRTPDEVVQKIEDAFAARRTATTEALPAGAEEADEEAVELAADPDFEDELET